MVTATCGVCKQPSSDVRMRTDGGSYGPVDVQTCRACHDAEMASIRAEGKRLHMRLKTQRWESLTAQGAYSEVR